MSESEFVIEAANERFEPHSDQWADQVQELLSELNREVGKVRQNTAMVEGKKGGAAEIVLALGSAGAMVAGVLVWQLGWLWADPAASIVIAVLVGRSAILLLRDTHRALRAAPRPEEAA